MSIHKNCENCGTTFLKDPRNTWKYWEKAKYCSQACAGLAWSKKAIENRKPIAAVFEKWFQQTNGCWDWQGGLDKDGYGAFSYAGKTYKAHRMALELQGIKIPKGHYVCHHCDNPSCVNPDHLYVGTPADNVRDMMQRNRHWRQRKSVA